MRAGRPGRHKKLEHLPELEAEANLLRVRLQIYMPN